MTFVLHFRVAVCCVPGLRQSRRFLSSEWPLFAIIFRVIVCCVPGLRQSLQFSLSSAWLWYCISGRLFVVFLVFVKVTNLVCPVCYFRFAFQGDCSVPGLRQSHQFSLFSAWLSFCISGWLFVVFLVFVKAINLVHPACDFRIAFQGDFNVPGLRQSRLFGLKVVFLLLFFSCGRLWLHVYYT